MGEKSTDERTAGTGKTCGHWTEERKGNTVLKFWKPSRTVGTMDFISGSWTQMTSIQEGGQTCRNGSQFHTHGGERCSRKGR